MGFADNKTKTWHDARPETPWSIGTYTEDLRFLGYWISKDEKTDGYSKHVKHWLTKANFSFNQIRALTQRTNGGLNTRAMVRLLTTVTRTMAWYGLEFFGSHKQRCKEVDSFMYETIKRLFDMPTATPHRAILAEFALTPTAIQYEYVKGRNDSRRTKLEVVEKANSIANVSNEAPADAANDEEEPLQPWTVPLGETKGLQHRTLPDNYPTGLEELCKLIAASDIIAYTDGSQRPNEPPSFGLVLYDHEGRTITEENGKLCKGKTIVDAETTAIYMAMELAMEQRDNVTIFQWETNRCPRKVIILSDSRTAIQAVTEPRQSGNLAYLNHHRIDVEQHPQRPNTVFLLKWVKGHSQKTKATTEQTPSPKTPNSRRTQGQARPTRTSPTTCPLQGRRSGSNGSTERHTITSVCRPDD